MKKMNKSFYIIDDHELLRLGTSNWLTTNSAWLCAGNASTHEDALADLKKLCAEDKLPSVVICDINFYGENSGLDFISKILSIYPGLKIIVYSMYFAAGVVQNAIKNGACGYVSKNAQSQELLNCMEKALAGEFFIQEELKNNLIKYNKITDALTRREKEVMEMLLLRCTNDEIANQLGIKKRAVENYISTIYEKTGVNARSELIDKYGN